MKNKLPFQLPESFLTQLEEFTNGYHLVVVDENMAIQSYSNFPTEIVALGVINHLEIESSRMQEDLRSDVTIMFGPEYDDEEEEDDDEDLDGTED